MKRRLLINRILALLVCGAMCVSCVMPAAAAPAEAEKKAEIHLTEVKGNVTVINGSGREIPYTTDMAPDNGDHVKTQESSYPWMDLGNGSTAKMDAHSCVEFRTSGSKKEILLDDVEAADVDLSSQAEAALGRLQEEESGLQQKLDELNGKLEEQENNITKYPTWEGGVKPEEGNIVAGVEIPFPAPGRESTFGEEILTPFPSASPAVPSPETENGSNNKSEPKQGESVAAPSEPAYNPDNEPEPGQGESTAAEPVTNPDGASTGPNNSLVVKGISENQGFVRVGKDGQIVFKDTFTNTTSSSWVENEGQITFEGNLNNEDWACITNKAQIMAKMDICNYDHAHIRNKGQIKAEKDVYNGLAGTDKSFIYTNEPSSRFDVAGKYVNGNASLSMTGGTISEFGQSDGDVEILSDSVTVKNGYVITGGSLDMSAGTLEAGSSNAALTVNISSSGAAGSSEGVNIYGGTIFGNGSGKAAISAVSGDITIDSTDAGDGGSPYGPVVVKAYNIFDTIRSDGNNWNAVMYLDNHLDKQYKADCNSSIYVGREDGSLVYLGCVGNSLSNVFQRVDYGDVITLKDDVSIDGTLKTKEGSNAVLNLNGKCLEANMDFVNDSWMINGRSETGSVVGTIKMTGGSLDLIGGKYKYNDKSDSKNFSIIYVYGGKLSMSGGVCVEGSERENSSLLIPVQVSAKADTEVVIENADIDGKRCPALAGDGENAITLTVGDGANIFSGGGSYCGTVYLEWKEGKRFLNLNGGEITNTFHEFIQGLDGVYEETEPAVFLMTEEGDGNISQGLSEIHTKLVSATRTDLGISYAVRIDDNEYRTVPDGNRWKLELINPDGSKAAEASVMNEEANPLEDEEITELEADGTLEAENPDESKDSEDEENPDGIKEPSESEDPSKPKDPSGSEDPKKPAEGGGDESGSGDKETHPGSGDEGGSADREIPPGGGDVLPPENAGDKKEEEPAGDEGAGKEGGAAREQSE